MKMIQPLRDNVLRCEQALADAEHDEPWLISVCRSSLAHTRAVLARAEKRELEDRLAATNHER